MDRPYHPNYFPDGNNDTPLAQPGHEAEKRATLANRTNIDMGKDRRVPQSNRDPLVPRQPGISRTEDEDHIGQPNQLEVRVRIKFHSMFRIESPKIHRNAKV